MNRRTKSQALKHNRDQIKNKGFDYRNQILRRSVDPNLQRNPNVLDFINKVEPMIEELIFRIKNFKAYRNPYIDAESDDIN